ncbi:MAG TPA: hypothetical protein DIS66_08105 [Candidatus Omnitrophica bacterium]|nr:hypothetical protein [Candidatus Omnitrophota bacterium]
MNLSGIIFSRASCFCQNQRGSLLILTLSSLAVLSLLAFSVGYTVRQKLQVVSRLENREQLRFAGEAAAEKAAELILQYAGKEGERLPASFHALNQNWSRNPSFKSVDWQRTQFSILAGESGENAMPAYGLIDEERKINLNAARPEVLQNLFSLAAGVEREESRRIVAAIRDWKDADDDLTDGGAESKDYKKMKLPYQAQNAPFNALKELLWVRGVTPSIYARVEPYLTLDGKWVNLNTASMTVLEAMKIERKIAKQIIDFRKGKDGEEGTADDGVFQSLSDAPQVLARYFYLSDEDQQRLRGWLNAGFDVRSEYFSARIVAQIKGGRLTARINAVIDKKGVVLRWFEEFV